MNLYDAISKRKASRKFIDTPLDNKELEQIIVMLEDFELLYPESPLNFRVVNHTKGMFNVDAPHYLIISGQGKKYEKENAGYVGQRFVLWLHTKDIGSVWQGKSKAIRKNRNKNDIIVIAFGKSKVSIERDLSEFRRKDIDSITNIPNDDCIKAVHIAPSGMNLQPWYFKQTEDKIIVYRQKVKFPLSLAYKITEVDLGIALCHFSLACKQYNKTFSFKPLSGKSDKKGFRLFGEITY